ncbi:hypothetical protein H4R21_005839, partial [Coemansia helicoidea]
RGRRPHRHLYRHRRRHGLPRPRPGLPGRPRCPRLPQPAHAAHNHGPDARPVPALLPDHRLCREQPQV